MNLEFKVVSQPGDTNLKIINIWKHLRSWDWISFAYGGCIDGEKRFKSRQGKGENPIQGLKDWPGRDIRRPTEKLCPGGRVKNLSGRIRFQCSNSLILIPPN